MPAQVPTCRRRAAERAAICCPGRASPVVLTLSTPVYHALSGIENTKKITIYASRNPSFFSSVTMHATSIWYRCARLVYRGPGQRSYGTWVRAVVRGLCEW